jgi:hypothetical protein
VLVIRSAGGTPGAAYNDKQRRQEEGVRDWQASLIE